MDFTNDLFLIGVSFGLISIIAGFILLKYPPKSINYLYGYRTKNSMKSQKVWDFAQVYSAKLMIKGGLVFVLLGGLGLVVPLSQTINVMIGLGTLLLFCFYLFYKTEKKLKQKFNNDKNHI
tara:strand:+ start:38117 stop:38479 length:363 start_codon:yes stop_codon:yes gene_type:complete